MTWGGAGEPDGASDEGGYAPLLRRVAEGDLVALGRVVEDLRAEMHAAATALLRREPRQVTVEATALLSELYLRLHDHFARGSEAAPLGLEGPWERSEDFLRYARAVMRNLLAEAARRRGALKRGAGLVRELVDETPLAVDGPPELTLLLDDACTALAEAHPGTAELLELVRFGGLTPRQAGAALGLARRDADAKWAFARAWLARRFGE